MIHSCLVFSDIVVDNCAICRNHIMDLCKLFEVSILCFESSWWIMLSSLLCVLWF